MRATYWTILVAIVLVGCGSDNKLDDPLGPDGQGDGPGTTGTSPNGETETTPDETGIDTHPTGTTDTGSPDDPTNPTNPTAPTGPDDTGWTDDEICAAAAALSSILDPFQTPDDDRVTYCHSSSGGNYHLVDSDISSCLPHVNHAFDVFPTTGCDS